MKTTHKRPMTKDEANIINIDTVFAGMRTCVIRRRLRADIHHHVAQKMRNMPLQEQMYAPMDRIVEIETKRLTNSNSYEYFIPNIGWVSKRVYSHFKSKMLKEEW